MVKNPPVIQEMQRCGFNSWVGKIPQRRKWQPTPVFLPGKSHGQEEHGRSQPTGLQRIRHDQTTKQLAEHKDEGIMRLYAWQSFVLSIYTQTT